MSTPAESQSHLAGVKGRLNATLDVLTRGELPDFAPLVDDIQRLCQGLVNTPPEKAKPFIDELIGLLDELERLRGTLMQQRDEVQEKLNRLTTGQQAASAYLKNTTKK
ncbi:MAG: hypothetical protein O7A65_09140 [Proteobacteria bacterium]|nr:hypothetical protein [Pseudomonadota bacterium]